MGLRSTKPIEYIVRRKGADETPQEASQGAGKMVARITCADCGRITCIAQTNDWPPTGPVTLHIGIDWPEPKIVDDAVLCGECGGETTNVS